MLDRFIAALSDSYKAFAAKFESRMKETESVDPLIIEIPTEDAGEGR